MQSKGPTWAFVAIAVPWAVALTFVTPPYQVPDETAHFYRGAAIANGQLFPRWYGDVLGADLPASVELTAREAMIGIPFNPAAKMDVEKLKRLLHIPIEPEKRAPTDFWGLSVYFPLIWFPPAFGVALGNALDVPVLWLLYLARLTNAFVAIALTALAIQLMPLHRWTMAALALIPMVAFSRSSASGDAFTLSAAFLLIALFLHVSRKDGPASRSELVMLFVLSVAVAMCKQVYFVLSLAVLFIPPEKLGSRRRFVVYAASIVGVSFLVAAWWSASVQHLFRNLQATQIDVKGQTAHVLAHPVGTALVVVGDLWSSGADYLDMAIGRMGWLDTTFPRPAYKTLLILLPILALLDVSQVRKLALAERAWAWAIFFAGAGAIGLTLYIAWTPKGLDHVLGIQGRYYLPLAPLLLLPLCVPRIPHRLAQGALPWLRTGVFLAFAIVSVVATVQILMRRYYGIG